MKVDRARVDFEIGQRGGDFVKSRDRVQRTREKNAKRVPAKLAAEWRAKLAESGFVDIEPAVEKDGPLSNRETIHEGGDTSIPMDVRIEDGSTYLSWAGEVLPKLGGHSRAGKKRRQIWALHAEGYSLNEIARKLKLTYWAVRETVVKIQLKYGRAPGAPRSRAAARRAVARWMRQSSTETLVALAASIARAESKAT